MEGVKELIENIEEFFESGNDNLNKKRFNAAVSDYFKTIVITCDYLIYKEIRILPKNHNQRFSLLKLYFKETYEKVSEYFKTYTKSYSLKSNKQDAIKLRDYANEIKNNITNKK